jgi:hypothetical protein
MKVVGVFGVFIAPLQFKDGDSWEKRWAWTAAR